MNIQHSQQIQHIRYAKQYTQFARRPASGRGSRGRWFGIAFTAIAAMVGFTGVRVQARRRTHSVRPRERPSRRPRSRQTRTPSPRRVSAAPADRPWGSKPQRPSAAHTYGAPYDSFGFKGGGGPSERCQGSRHRRMDASHRRTVRRCQGSRHRRMDAPPRRQRQWVRAVRRAACRDRRLGAPRRAHPGARRARRRLRRMGSPPHAGHRSRLRRDGLTTPRRSPLARANPR